MLNYATQVKVKTGHPRGVILRPLFVLMARLVMLEILIFHRIKRSRKFPVELPLDTRYCTPSPVGCNAGRDLDLYLVLQLL